jgi:hypothetical protein
MTRARCQTYEGAYPLGMFARRARARAWPATRRDSSGRLLAPRARRAQVFSSRCYRGAPRHGAPKCRRKGQLKRGMSRTGDWFGCQAVKNGGKTTAKRIVNFHNPPSVGPARGYGQRDGGRERARALLHGGAQRARQRARPRNHSHMRTTCHRVAPLSLGALNSRMRMLTRAPCVPCIAGTARSHSTKGSSSSRRRASTGARQAAGRRLTSRKTVRPFVAGRATPRRRQPSREPPVALLRRSVTRASIAATAAKRSACVCVHANPTTALLTVCSSSARTHADLEGICWTRIPGSFQLALTQQVRRRVCERPGPSLQRTR